MYQEIKPSDRLADIIESFWTFSKNESSENFKVLPDTCSDLIFDLNKNQGYLSGIMTTYQLVELSKETDLIGVRFKSEKFGSLCKIPVDETKDLKVELSQILPTKKQNRLNQLYELETTTDKVHFIEKFVKQLFEHTSERQDLMILSIADNVRTLKGTLSIRDLANSHNISLRQLERRFKSYIGLTIKEFSNIVRFNNAKKSIANNIDSSLLEIAVDRGFFDHSHMTNEFQAIARAFLDNVVFLQSIIVITD